jgi:hypothetical protein
MCVFRQFQPYFCLIHPKYVVSQNIRKNIADFFLNLRFPNIWNREKSLGNFSFSKKIIVVFFNPPRNMIGEEALWMDGFWMGE